jgi:hypothetical protein
MVEKMSFKEKWEERVIKAMDYPIESGEFLGDMMITVSGSFLAGGIAFTIKYSSEHAWIGLGLMAMILGSVIANLYKWTYLTLKSYEHKYGPSGLGTEWKKKRDEKKLERTKK